jgi:hypothetical protein
MITPAMLVHLKLNTNKGELTKTVLPLPVRKRYFG